MIKEHNVRTSAEQQKSSNISTKKWSLSDAKAQYVESFDAEEAKQNVERFDVKAFDSFSSRFSSKMKILQLYNNT